MRYLLDTNAVIGLLNGNNPRLAGRVRDFKPADVGISSIVVHELFYGAFKSQRTVQNVALVDSMRFEMLAFDQEDARHAGQIRAALATKGKSIGPYDVLIAGQARARSLILVTHNTTEFKRVAQLQIEDWEV